MSRELIKQLRQWKRLDNPAGLAILDIDYYDRPPSPSPQPHVYVHVHYYITRLMVPYEHRRKGIGTELLKNCCSIADEYRCTLWLEVEPYDHYDGRGLDYKELCTWYSTFGFVEYRASGTFYRKPR